MGIKDLLKFMKPYVQPIHIKKYAGKRVGIDAYSWLHKGAYSCNMELCLNLEGDKKFRYLNYFMHRINLLRHYKITPVVVFDGGNIPCKASTDHERHRKRKTNLDLAMAKFNEGNVNAASELFQRAVSITPSMAHQLIQILRTENIEFVVAPYEADAQLAYLSSLEEEKGGIVAVISEDSDLLAYGCLAIVFKMDRYGNGEEIVLDKVFEFVAGVPSFQDFDKELFTGMCVLAGCDFLPSVPGIGIAKAYSLVSKYRNIDRVLSILKFQKGNQMPEDYSKSFREAVAVFQHARIYDADSKQLKHLKPLPENLLQFLDKELDFLGPEIPHSIAAAIAEGNLDPSTMEAFDYFPSSGIHLKPTAVVQSCDQVLRIEPIAVSTQKNSFTVISTQKARGEKIKGREQKPNVKERKLTNEAVELEKLVSPPNIVATEENETVADKILLKVPNNNPFRKRKADDDEVHLDELESVVTEQQQEVSVVTEVDNLETPKSVESVDSKPINKNGGGGKKRQRIDKKLRSNCQNSEKIKGMEEKPIVKERKLLTNEDVELEKLVFPSNIGATEENETVADKIPLKVPNNNPFRKRKADDDEVHLDELESVVTKQQEVSVVTDVDNLETPKSVESVDSKPVKKNGGGGKKSQRNDKKLRSNCQNSENQNSILNFFSRL
ncbi:exonuclease 1 [Cornus florida]|uniref:exonuclease 1 n=1 Tax=Cornus florida TaxID=4283 RepID=UPI0028994140|nr:exonuclease 1 [Cornus florida]